MTWRYLYIIKILTPFFASEKKRVEKLIMKRYIYFYEGAKATCKLKNNICLKVGVQTGLIYISFRWDKSVD